MAYLLCFLAPPKNANISNGLLYPNGSVIVYELRGKHL